MEYLTERRCLHQACSCTLLFKPCKASEAKRLGCHDRTSLNFSTERTYLKF